MASHYNRETPSTLTGNVESVEGTVLLFEVVIVFFELDRIPVSCEPGRLVDCGAP